MCVLVKVINVSLSYAAEGWRIFVDPKHIEAIISWSRPTLVSEVLSFLGLVGYY